MKPKSSLVNEIEYSEEEALAENVKAIEFTDKQWEFIAKGNHALNFKEGATRAGKTFLDFVYTIPARIVERKAKQGLAFIFGVSKSSIERNVLSPMRAKWGQKLVSGISSDNTAQIFNETVYCIGDSKSSQEAVIRGTDIKYAYMDEATECNEDVFMLILSRLDRECSVLDATYNPKDPNHWLKKFIDTAKERGLDIWVQHYTIWDNPTLPQQFVDNLCKSYMGTVFYGRYILGNWENAEGVIYKKFADHPEKYIIDEAPKDIMIYSCGIDFGGNISKHTFVLSGITRMYSSVVVLEEEEIPDRIDAVELASRFVDFCKRCEKKYHCYFESNYDNADPVTARTLSAAAIKNHCRTELLPAWKSEILTRIQLIVMLIGSNRFHVMRNCKYVINSLKSCVWSNKEKDTRLDDGHTNDIDILDALEYSIEKYRNKLLDYEFVGINKGADLYESFR